MPPSITARIDDHAEAGTADLTAANSSDCGAAEEIVSRLNFVLNAAGVLRYPQASLAGPSQKSVMVKPCNNIRARRNGSRKSARPNQLTERAAGMGYFCRQRIVINCFAG